VRLDAKAQALLASVGATHVMLTLSHIDSHAMAVAALVKQV
jgi:holo-[acyl-carrier protein] synthase